jgi:iron-sulfur cluster repair protein YtfE (RIC family)
MRRYAQYNAARVVRVLQSTSPARPRKELAMVMTAAEAISATPTRNLKAAAKSSGLRGIFLRLVQEHGELTALLLRLRMSPDVATRVELFPIVRAELLSHERAEAEVLFSAMRRKEQTRLIAVKHKRTSGEIASLLYQLESLDYASPSWEGGFTMLFNTVEQHMIEEESYYFPIAQRVLGDTVTHALRALYDDSHDAILSNAF